MKPYLLIVCSMFIHIVMFAQLQFVSSVKQGDLNMIPGIRVAIEPGITFPLVGPFAPLQLSLPIYATTGIQFTNNGLKYATNNTKFIHRLLGIAVPLEIGIIRQKILYMGLVHQFNFNYHYRHRQYSYHRDTIMSYSIDFRDEKIYDSKHAPDIEGYGFFSKRTKIYYPSLGLSAGMRFDNIGRFSVRLRWYYRDFFNPQFSYINAQGLIIKPYNQLEIGRYYTLSIGYSPGL